MKDLLNAIIATQDARDECVRTANEHIAALKETLVAGFHPLNLGDKVEVNGVRFTGKTMLAEKLRVGTVRAGSMWFKAYGRVLKVDGTPRSNEAIWAQKVEF